ncbi:hypothetical protein MNBD_GAMMA22-177 [hydrothermal vent metagenome]|uniref:Uncharacterized protein n=1 Tax=hydrothermal vent metagenome TaxID=652676 RepID=A0A3B1AUG7_9ZZZZ
MPTILVESNIAQWHRLVLEAQEITQTPLSEDLESYLVFMLMRNMKNSNINSKVMAMEYINSIKSHGSERELRLREVGDQCLLFSGLFPQRAQRRHMKVKYYVDLGRTAYLHLADDLTAGVARLYQQLSDSFIYIMDTLLAIRSMTEKQQEHDVLLAFELWQDLKSQYSFDILQQRLSNKTKTLSVMQGVSDSPLH